MSVLCQVVESNGEHACKVCGWGTGKGRTKTFRRNCDEGPVARPTYRERVEADLADDPHRTRSMEAIGVDLDKCFGGCKHFRGVCTLHPKRCERYQRWVELLLDGDCPHYSPPIPIP